MDLQKYFASLGEKLVSGGMSEAQSAAYCKRLIASLESLDEKAREEKLASYGSPDHLAERVLAIAGKQKAQEGEAEPAKPAAAMEHTVNVDKNAKTAARKAAATQAIPVVQTGDSSTEKAPAPAGDQLQATQKKVPPIKVEEHTEEEAPKKPISKRGMQIFWWTAGLTSPITLFLLGVVAGLFAAAYAALLFIAVAMIVAVTVTVIGGILLSLVCLGYGVVKMLPGTDAFFIGLYEFGLGLILVGGTIVFPILEYNCATVLVPYTAKKLTVFLKFTIRQIKRLVIYLYDLCRDL